MKIINMRVYVGLVLLDMMRFAYIPHSGSFQINTIITIAINTITLRVIMGIPLFCWYLVLQIVISVHIDSY